MNHAGKMDCDFVGNSPGDFRELVFSFFEEKIRLKKSCLEGIRE
jgi:hypothetical protein